MAIVSEETRLVAALECRIGKAHIAVPTQSVSRIIEYPTYSMPLAERWIGGIGIHENAPIMSIALVPHRAASDGGVVKGILLDVPTSPLTWALEIQEVFIFIRAEVQPRREIAGQPLPRWMATASTADGRSVGWIHVAAMLADLARVVEPDR